MPVTYFWMVNYMPLKIPANRERAIFITDILTIFGKNKATGVYDHRERLLGRTSLFENTISETFNQNKGFFQVSKQHLCRFT